MTISKSVVLSAVMALGVALAPHAYAENQDVTVIHAGHLLAVPGKAVKAKQTIVVKNGRVEAILDGFVDPATAGVEGARVQDLSGKFVLPGLIDSHVHILSELDPKSVEKEVKLSNASKAFEGVKFAQRTLRAGFTTVRDLGATPESLYALRGAIRQGIVSGPRIVAAGGAVSATGGHGDVNGFRTDVMDLFASRTVCDGPYDCRRAVREAVKQGADVIKIPATGGVLSNTATGTDQQLADDEMKEIVATAHSLGRKVAAHAHGKAGIMAALRAGVDSIDHGTYTDKEAIKLFRKTGAYLVPTLLAGDTVVQIAKSEKNFLPEPSRLKALKVGPVMMANFKGAYKGGVKIAFGTDSGVSRHGDNAKEFVLMRDAAGMTNVELIYSATVAAADLLDISAETGTIEVGKSADIIATDGSPLDDIEELLDVDFVMKSGRIAKDK